VSPEELIHLSRELHALGAVHIKHEDFEVTFAPRQAEQAPTYPQQRPLSEIEQHIQAALGSS
jgi:hypothetical protein